MADLKNKVEAVVSAKEVIIGKVATHGMELYAGMFVAKYQEAVEADTAKVFAKTLEESKAEVVKHLRGLYLEELAKSITAI